MISIVKLLLSDYNIKFHDYNKYEKFHDYNKYEKCALVRTLYTQANIRAWIKRV